MRGTEAQEERQSNSCQRQGEGSWPKCFPHRPATTRVPRGLGLEVVLVTRWLNKEVSAHCRQIEAGARPDLKVQKHCTGPACRPARGLDLGGLGLWSPKRAGPGGQRVSPPVYWALIGSKPPPPLRRSSSTVPLVRGGAWGGEGSPAHLPPQAMVGA